MFAQLRLSCWMLVVMPHLVITEVKVDWKEGKSEPTDEPTTDKVSEFMKEHFEDTIIVLKRGIITEPACGIPGKNLVVYAKRPESEGELQSNSFWCVLFWESALLNKEIMFKHTEIFLTGRPLLRLELAYHLKALYDFHDEWEFGPTWKTSANYVKQWTHREIIESIVKNHLKNYFNRINKPELNKIKLKWHNLKLTDLAVKNQTQSGHKNANRVNLFAVVYEYEYECSTQKFGIQFGMAVQLSRTADNEIAGGVVACTKMNDLQYSMDAETRVQERVPMDFSLEHYCDKYHIPINQLDYCSPEKSDWKDLLALILQADEVKKIYGEKEANVVDLFRLRIQDDLDQMASYLFVGCKLSIRNVEPVEAYYFNVLVKRTDTRHKPFTTAGLKTRPDISHTPVQIFRSLNPHEYKKCGEVTEIQIDEKAAKFLRLQAEEAAYYITIHQRFGFSKVSVREIFFVRE